MFTESGGIEVARTEERMQELAPADVVGRARGASSGVSIVTPAEIKEMVPFIDECIIVGGFHTDGRRRRRLAARGHDHARARPGGRRAHASRRTPRCSGSTSSTAASAACAPRAATSRPRSSSSPAASGARSIARMAGASIPLTPAVHQMIDVGPVPHFADAKSHIEYPIVRDMDTNMYERQDGAGLEIGSYAHRADPARPRGDPLGRGGVALADRVPVHAGRLRPADGACARADARDRRRRVGRREVRDQRPALADARRPAAPRRDARGEGPLVGAPPCG